MVKAAGLRAVPNVWWERRMETHGWRGVKSQAGTAIASCQAWVFPARQRCKHTVPFVSSLLLLTSQSNPP